jgi:hypothetical protein
MPIYGGPQQSAPTGALSSMMGGANASPLGGLVPSPYPTDPMMGMLGAMMQPAGIVPPSPLTQALSQTSQSLLANPQRLQGALSQAQTARDAATQEKMAAISRAMNVLQNIPAQNPRMTQLAQGAGFLAPTHTGQFSESLGNAASSALGEAQRQQGAESANALDLMKLGLARAGMPEDAAEQTAGDIYKQIQVGSQLGNTAMLGQYRDELGRSRMMTPFVNAQTRLSVAQLNADKNRWAYQGPSSDTPGMGLYLDRNSPPGQPRTVEGPLVGAKPRAGGDLPTPDRAMSQARQDYNDWKKQDIANGGKGTVYNSDNSVADPERWVSNQAQRYLHGSAPLPAQQPGGAPAQGQTPAAQAAPLGTKENPAQPATTDEFNALPSGTVFVNPADGRIMQKK